MTPVDPSISPAPSTHAVISARHLCKRFGELRAVDDVSFDIPAGRCFGFLGPNGAGKTTTLKMLMGLADFDAGELSVLGKALPDQARAIRARVGLVPQGDNLDPDFTVRENLFMYARFFGLARQRVAERVDWLLEFANLTHKADARVDQLSGGMQRRLTIVRALVNDPEIVILDEPTSGLDPQVRHVIWGRLAELRERGVTLVLTSHYMEEAERLCDELVVMDHGRILDQGTPAALIRRHVESDVVEIRGPVSDEVVETLSTMALRVERHGTAVYAYTREPAPILDFLGQPDGLTVIHRRAGLEDVFLHLTGRELRE
ncbi:MAG: ATP-binding cassette domain-containing protein [Halothiobacillaceae bacterium]|nr:ATP-binding cassette domain-containing protein [Halothiobacillaceae bacterium]HER33987.1 ATP-binding cassette domain-containing protein [Halothiobacillaceae bacterium]